MITISELALSPEVEVFTKVAAYMDHGFGLRDLEDWMARHTTWLLTAERSDSTELAGLVELNLAEISLGHATEDDLRQDIERFLASHRTLNVCVPCEVRSGSNSVVTESPWTVRPEIFFGTPRVEASA